MLVDAVGDVEGSLECVSLIVSRPRPSPTLFFVASPPSVGSAFGGGAGEPRSRILGVSCVSVESRSEEVLSSLEGVNIAALDDEAPDFVGVPCPLAPSSAARSISARLDRLGLCRRSVFAGGAGRGCRSLPFADCVSRSLVVAWEAGGRGVGGADSARFGVGLSLSLTPAMTPSQSTEKLPVELSGAATCFGGAPRLPLRGRSKVGEGKESAEGDRGSEAASLDCWAPADGRLGRSVAYARV